MRWLLCAASLVIACGSCGRDRLRSARGDSADRERAAQTLGERLAELVTTSDSVVPLREVISSRSLVGRRIRVAGRCAFPLTMIEPPAGRRDTFQLEADGITVLVVGQRPSRCSRRDPAPLTLTVVVREDTLSAIGDLPTTPRRYLLLVDAK
jgi:hypothetical protein